MKNNQWFSDLVQEWYRCAPHSSICSAWRSALLLRFRVYQRLGCQSRRELPSPLPVSHGEDHLGLWPFHWR